MKLMMCFSAIIVSLFLTVAVEANEIENQEFESIVQEVLKKHQQTPQSGLSLSIFTKDQIVHMKGYGLRNRELSKPVTPQTLFAIGSTTKAFTALGLKLLENNGELHLSDKVKKHLPLFQLSNEMITNEATIEDLLSHRIGLPRHDLMWLLSDFSREENIKRLAYLGFGEKAEEQFRKTFSYNNFLITAAGLVIEEKTNTSYEQYIQTHILNKIGMTSTYLTVPPMNEREFMDLAEPYYGNVKAEHRDIAEMAPAGSIYSNAVDMTKWIQSYLNYKWRGQEDLFKVRIPIDNDNPDLNYGYGLCWMANTMRSDVQWFFHDGAIDGFTTVVLFSHELNFGMVALINQNGSSLPSELVGALLKYKLSKLPKNKSFVQPFVKLKNVDGKPLFIKNKKTKAFHGELFENPGYGVMTKYEREGSTYLNYYGAEWKLSKIEDELFNFITQLTLGKDVFDFPFKIEDNMISAPFEMKAGLIEFQKM
jgi:CubicO group peptidase (beta-lactamase class C family)